MKSDYQVISLLATTGIASQTDLELISSFTQKRQIQFRFFKPELRSSGVTISTFLKWYDEGFGNGDFCLFQDIPHVVSEGYPDRTQIQPLTAPYTPQETVPENLTHITLEQSYELDAELSRKGYEYNRDLKRIAHKIVPSINQKVRFYDQERVGLGVIRSIDPSQEILEFYCYYIYNTGEIGYNMHEVSIAKYSYTHFEPMSVPGIRRLNSELEKFGKVWYDKLHRIEPTRMRASDQGKYFFIDDKMKLRETKEKGTPTSNQRYIAGNYFTSREEALEVLGRMTDMLKDNLAKEAHTGEISSRPE